ncbi:GTP-binding protein, partial [candidate division KSB1 bacterium]|nr:GTP-binding protein [candidate division KSB1 bacterium]
MPIIIGTAGHIDHGKSALVKALTGTDPDRLIEEKERGLTIDLGFAFLNDDIAFIDVPGHERFIKNMVAGVSTIDLAMLVIAADDGVMPQTREHLDILSLLRVRQGLVVLNKIDLVDTELLQLLRQEVADFLQGSF